MAERYQVVGPARVSIQASDVVGAAWADGDQLGLTDNDEMISIDFEDRRSILEATDTGREPGEVVNVGRIAIITFRLTKFDEDVATELLSGFGETTQGKAGVIGKLLIGLGSATVDDDNAFMVHLSPISTPTALNPAYEFKRCFLDGPGSVRLFDFGNEGKKLACQIVAIRDGLGNLYTEITS